ncbi:MAG: phosphate acetyltransferase [Pseudomonadota bacterium]
METSGAMGQIYDRARAARRHIVLPEGGDPRVVEGANRAVELGLADVTLLGGPEGIELASSELVRPLQEQLLELRAHKGMTRDQAALAIREPLNFAAMMVHAGFADGTLAGAVHTTGDTVRTAFQLIGRAPGVKSVSSFFLMVLPVTGDIGGRTVIFADCALSIEPDAEQLAEIAVAAADNFTAFTGEAPRIGMLSFSTMGSAHHPAAKKVADASALVGQARPDLAISGELQFDAAFVPSVGAAKAPGAAVQGDANVFVFPSLEAGNIGYKIAQRIGGAQAIGPVLQGLARPANDLSRGCSPQDVTDMIAVTAVQAGMTQA